MENPLQSRKDELIFDYRLAQTINSRNLDAKEDMVFYFGRIKNCYNFETMLSEYSA